MVRWEAWLPCHLLSNFIFWLPHISWRVSSIIFWKLINFRQRLFPVFVDTYFSPADRNPWHWVVKMPNQGWVCLGDTGKGTLSRPGWDRAEEGEDRGPAASRPALPPGHGPFPGSQRPSTARLPVPTLLVPLEKWVQGRRGDWRLKAWTRESNVIPQAQKSSSLSFSNYTDPADSTAMH